MTFREANPDDIPSIQFVRHAVKENTLSDPSLVTDEDCADYLSRRGKGWVCEVEGRIVGFSIADLSSNNVWALFVLPDYEGKGIGQRLHALLLDWYFAQTSQTIWLGTAPNTRAAGFYRKAGWKETGVHGKGEIKFEMEALHWESNRLSIWVSVNNVFKVLYPYPFLPNYVWPLLICTQAQTT